MSGTPKYKVAFDSFVVEVVCHARENPSECLILLRMIANLAISFRVASGLQIECYQKTNVLPVHNIQYEVSDSVCETSEPPACSVIHCPSRPSHFRVTGRKAVECRLED